MNKIIKNDLQIKESIKSKIMNYGIKVSGTDYEYKDFMSLLALVFHELHNEIIEELFRQFSIEEKENFHKKNIEFLQKCEEELSKITTKH